MGRARDVWNRVVTTLRAGVYPRATARARTWGATILVLGCTSCNIFTLEQDVELGAQAYEEILANEPLVTSGAAYDMANRVTTRLVEAARHFDPEIVDAFAWEVRVIKNDGMVNAFALPGGKMAVYTGILPVAGSDEGLAVVMGHEIAHVIERHGTNAMTRQFGTSVVIDILFSQDVQGVAELAAGLVHLKFGRGAELSADQHGLRIMAQAGYDPREAVRFWTRMSELGGDAPPEWLSTHPAHDTRIEQIESLLPEAISIYEASGATGGPRQPSL